MTLPQFLPLFSAVFTFVLGLFVFLRNIRAKSNILFSIFCFGTTIWLFGTFMMFKSQTDGEAIFWDRFIYIGGILNPIFLYHFGRVFLNIKKRSWLLYLGYILAVLFLISSRTDYFVADLYKYTWGVHTQARTIHHLFLLYFIGFMILFLIDVLNGIKQSAGVKKIQIKYIFVALSVMSIIGTPAFLPAYGVDIYPFAYLSGTVFAAIVAYAITRYRLMGITVVIRRTTVYLISFLVAISLFLGFLLSFLKILNLEIPWHIITFEMFLVGIIVLIFPALINFFQKVANKYFFASLYQSEKILEDLVRKVPTIINLPQLLGLICKTLKDCFHLNRIGVLLYDPKTSNYQALVAEGFHPQNGLTLVRNNFLIQYLNNNKKPLAHQELKPILQATPRNQRNKISSIKKLEFHMKKIEASVCCPLVSKNKLIGILILGPKMSGDPYFKEDLEFLENLSYQISIGLENATLYSEVKNFSKKLKKEVDKATKDLKKAYAELQRLDEAKSEFMSITSHQLRTPLTAIKGFISMMLEGSYGKLPPKIRAVMGEVYKSNERLITLVNNLLNVSRIEAGTIEMTLEKTSLEEIISEVLTGLKLEAKKKKLKLVWEKPKKALPEILMDKEKIRQVILNILDNAIKYTSHGQVTVEVKSQKSKVKRKEEVLLIKIADTGEGMTKEELSHLFESFSRGTAGVKFWTEGVGLGLYVAKKFVELHDGKIWAKSAGEGKGSTFYIELPLK